MKYLFNKSSLLPSLPFTDVQNEIQIRLTDIIYPFNNHTSPLYQILQRNSYNLKVSFLSISRIDKTLLILRNFQN